MRFNRFLNLVGLLMKITRSGVSGIWRQGS